MNEEKPDHDSARAEFIAHLDRYEGISDPELESVRFVSTPLSAGEVSADLHTKLDAGDKIIVAQVMEGTYCGWLSKDVWAWTEARVQPPQGGVDPAATPPAPPVAGDP